MSEKVYNRIEEIDIARGIAAVLMILGHSFISYPVDISKIEWCYRIQSFIYEFHMELFFLIAGLVYQTKEYQKYISKKIHRILVPYITFGIIVMFLKAFGGGAINGIEPINYGFIKFLLYGGNYWFLYVSFLVYLIYPVIDKYLSNIGKVILIIVLLSIVNFSQNIALFKLTVLMYHLPYFIIGNILNGNQIFKKISRNKSIVLVTIMTIVSLFIPKPFLESNYFLRFTNACILSFAVLSISYRISIIECIYVDVIKEVLIKCGQYSLQLYIFNGFLMTFIRIVMCNILGITNAIMLVSGIWIFDILLTFLIIRLVIMPYPIIRKVCGV